MWKLLSLAIAFSFTTSLASAQTRFNVEDENNDGKISKDEFYGFVSDSGIYPDWDLDDDGRIEAKEFNEIEFDQGFADFDAWDVDRDTYLDEDEVYDGIFTGFDDNEDGHWDGAEWDDAGDAGFWDV